VGNNNGSPIGALGYANGKIGQAFSFDGTSSFVLINNTPALNPAGGFTIAGWIFPRQDADQAIFSKWEDYGVNNRSYELATVSGRGLSFPISDRANQFNSVFQTFTVEGVLTLDSWNHVAATYDSTSGIRSIYVNGAKVASFTNAPVAVYNCNVPVTIGTWMRTPGLNQNYFRGLIDEVAVYNRALSDDEINSLAEATAPAQPAAMVK